jgi:hypothetical protein
MHTNRSQCQKNQLVNYTVMMTKEPSLFYECYESDFSRLFGFPGKHAVAHNILSFFFSVIHPSGRVMTTIALPSVSNSWLDPKPSVYNCWLRNAFICTYAAQNNPFARPCHMVFYGVFFPPMACLCHGVGNSCRGGTHGGVRCT